MSRCTLLPIGFAVGLLAGAMSHWAFTGVGVPGAEMSRQAGTPAANTRTDFGRAASADDGPHAAACTAFSFFGGLCLGVMLLLASPEKAAADIEDVQIAVDGKGKTTTLTKEQLVRGKRLFVASCSNCHVGGGTRTNQNVGLSTEELSGAAPSRANLEGMVNFLNAPMTYDGLYDISENHPSIKSADVFPKMRTMKQKDLVDISAYILYENQAIPEKWGGGKIYY